MNQSKSSGLRILWVKSGPLHPLDSGGKKRTHSMLVELNKRHSVTYLALKDPAHPLDPGEQRSAYADQWTWVPWREARKGSLRWCVELAANLIASTLPYALQKYRSRSMEELLHGLIESGDFDLVVCDFLFPALNFRGSGGGGKVTTVLFQHNIEAVIWERLAAGRADWIGRWYFGLQARRMRRWEKRLSERFDGVITVSPEDSEVARRDYGLANVAGDVPAGVDACYFKPAKSGDGRTVGFLGSMDWMPNIEGVRWFVEHVFGDPAIRAAGARLLVIGRRPPRSILELAELDPRIEVSGTVDDVRPWLERCDLLVVPLLSGGGTRIKIMEALAAGIPVVSTTVGAEGLGLVDGEHLVIADSAADFVRAVGSLLGDPARRDRLSRVGRELVVREYGWERASEVFIEHAVKVGLAKEVSRNQHDR